MEKTYSRRGFIAAGSVATVGSAARVAFPPSAGAQTQTGELATIYNTEQFLLTGPADRVFRIQISHPHADNPDIALMMQGRSPVPVYVLDGSLGQFGLFSAITRYMQWGGEVPPCLVVGIGYEDEGRALDYRLFDLTPPNEPGEGRYSGTNVGGGPGFREFLISTVRSLVESRFDVDSSNSVLFGHSLGGLFAMNTLLERPTAFRNILSVSPSLWFADRRVLHGLRERLENSFTFPGRLAAYVGEREERISPPDARMTSNVLDLGRIVAEYESSFGGVTVRVLPDESHHTILGAAATLGLRFLIGPEDKRSRQF